MTSTIKVNNIQNQCGANIINENSNTITLGASGDTVTLASGASQSGFGRSGSVNWQTTPKTTTFTAADGEGYFINSGSSLTANLPAGVAGAIVAFADYARNFATYPFSVTPNGSDKIGGTNATATLNIDGQAATFVFTDSTKGWINVQNAEDTEIGTSFISATGGSTSTVNCGACKVHTFTSPGTFCVASLSSVAANNEVSYIVVGGGGGGGSIRGAGGGAGGFREDKSPVTPYTASPLDGAGSITVTATGFPITVGAGGSGGTTSPSAAGDGSASTFSTITAAGGGRGGGGPAGPSSTRTGGPGGSGGGSVDGQTIGSGNTPSVSPSQGSNGGPGASSDNLGAGGGGGATATGTQGFPLSGSGGSGPGGAGAPTSITGSPLAYAGGGGGSGYACISKGCGGSSVGGNGATAGGAAQAGTTNRGGGGGGGFEPNVGIQPVSAGGAGGSGVVIIRYKVQ